MEPEIPKVYSPAGIEARWARNWIEKALYRPSEDSARPNFCLVIPPPNITGSLHMGHMLEHTEIDILMRWQRMQGKNVLWLPGTDHASIATQMIVERELGREALPDLEPGPDGGERLAARGATLAARDGPRQVRRALLEMEDGKREHHPHADGAPGRLVRLDAGTLHDGCRLHARGGGSFRAPLRRGIDLPRQVHRQLVSPLRHGGFGPGSHP